MRSFLILPALMSMVLIGCAHVKRATNTLTGKRPPSVGVPEVPAHLRAGPDGGGAPPLTRVTLDEEGVPVSPMNMAREGLMPGLPSEEDIRWTDPDNPDAPLEGLEETLAQAKGQSAGWEVSYTEATRRAVREGMPLLIWFTDTQRSPLCRSLSAEVFSAAAFEAFAQEHFVRLRIDFNVQGDDEDDRLRKKEYLATLKKRYKVNGLPTVLVMAPDGTVTGSYKGYSRGEGEFYFGRIRNATRTAEEQLVKWRASMEKKGYRVWKTRKDKQVFAKLLSYSKGKLIMVEPSGKRLEAKEKQLSDEDQEWIRAELAKRGR